MADITADGAAPASLPVRAVSAGYRSYAMALLLLIYIFNFIDRQVITIIAEPIKLELGLRDWQLGLMTGTAFALFYCTLGIPIARLAERRNRPWIIGLSLAAWSGFTALSGLAQNFWQLVLARVGVGIGEAGCTPPAHSLITDYVPQEKRASALAFYSMGTPIGALLGVIAGGLVADAYGWRWAFFLCGVPGLLLAIVVILTLVEPRLREASAQIRAAAPKPVPLREVVAVLARKRTFWAISGATSIIAFIGYGHAPFSASFFLRVHGQELGAWASQAGLGPIGFLAITLGLIAGIAGAIGTFTGGLIADRFGAKDLRAYMSVPGIAALITLPVYTSAMLMPSILPAVPLFIVNAVLGSLWYGPVYATVQSVVPPHMRATCAALFLFIVNLVGLGLGPLAVGALSDFLAGPMGLGSGEGVRWALIASTVLVIPAFGCFWFARGTIRAELEG